MAQARKPKAGRRTAYGRLLREIAGVGRRIERNPRGGPELLQAYFRAFQRLLVEARRGGHRVEVEFHGGRHQTIPGNDAASVLLTLVGAGARQGGRTGASPVVVLNPAFCAALGCKVVYTKGPKICLNVGCMFGGGAGATVTCLSVCLDMANGGGAPTVLPA